MSARRVRLPFRHLRSVLAAAVPLGFLLSAGLIWQHTQAAFVATTTNPGNTFAAGTVSLSDDDTASALFSVSALKPGSTGQKCVAVTFGGSLAAGVKLFVAPGDQTGSGLASYLDLTIEEGTGGGFGSCAGFTPSATDFSGTFASFASSATNSSTGMSAFAPSGPGQTKVYRFTYTLQDNNAAQGGTCQTTFTWEATNT